MKFYIFIFLLSFFCISSCVEEEPVPVEFKNKEISFSAVTYSEGDKDRLCMGDLVSQALADLEFRAFIKSESITDNTKIHNEILLFDILYKDYYGTKTVYELLKNTISKSNIECYSSIDEFVSDLEKDLTLVIKLPDVIPTSEWDINKIIPFLYVRTNDFCRSSNVTDTAVTWGLHHSGINDMYFRTVHYFPLILKQAEDYMVLDKDLYFQNGLHISNYFELFKTASYGTPPIYKEMVTSQGLYYVYEINELMEYLMKINGLIASDDIRTDSCEYYYDCIDIKDRKLILDTILYDEQNESARDYAYNGNLRYYGDEYLSDNIMPLLNRGPNYSDEILGFRILLGSYRMNQFFNVIPSIDISYDKVYYEGSNYELPNFTIETKVISDNKIKSPSLILAKEFELDKQITLSLLLLTIDSDVRNNMIDFGDQFYAHYYHTTWQNYFSLGYTNPSSVYGDNSIAFTCRR